MFSNRRVAERSLANQLKQTTLPTDNQKFPAANDLTPFLEMEELGPQLLARGDYLPKFLVTWSTEIQYLFRIFFAKMTRSSSPDKKLQAS